ncbi:amphoterin-induced protein 1 [Clupea harengus]|uniref:Amphoterin-induced protein 1 n=1 Tax=Clupea harengus TaxID=7950 RepID=A0A6P8FCT3_CLUHA|nr:amphoterin-induced protein 1 [Clupea harengus]
MMSFPHTLGKCVTGISFSMSACVGWVLCFSLLLLQLLGTEGSPLNCHTTCICASNVVSCSKMYLTTVPTALPLYTAVLDLSYNNITKLRAEWTPVKLPRLRNLLLAHNGLHFLSSEAFAHITQLRYLDLSSNDLEQLNEYIFEPLVHLEVLLLYNNRISSIDRTAFTGLNNLQKLYLSQNHISRFPLELIKDKTRLEKLSLFDMSSNKVKVLLIQELQNLPGWIKNGLYFHKNPLVCDCDLYSLLTHWYIRKFSSAYDFRDDYTCVLSGTEKRTVAAFELNTHLNCSTFKEEDEETYLDETVLLSCDTRHRNMTKTWTMPSNVPVTPNSNQSATVLPDGKLQLSSLRPEDSGVYTCFAVSEALNETLYVVVKVHNFTVDGNSDTLNTAYTTLVGCLASVVLVLIYLYLTPCRCFCCPDHNKDPKDLQGQNGKLNPNGEEDVDEDGLQGEAHRKKSVAESISSVFSDTPIVV